ncbi:MAG: Gfo/Idh/MocA family oxidoreductase [Candidatus Brocadiae bacterium]|nr:Gfo/Idh/MocA family oxidoreductase [Candidatus Brocadiia bacterium]
MEPYRVGFVGTTAPHSFLFLDTLRLIPDTAGEIHLVEPDAPRAAKAGADAVYDGLDEMLERGRPHICFIMLPTDEVEGPAIRCAEAGIPLVIDKHVANTSAAIRRILAACERGGVKMSTCYTWRYSPMAQDIRRWVEEGVVGQPYCFDARMVTTSAALRTQDPQFAWLFDHERSGGGILIWLGCHYIDLIRFILQRRVEAVCAMTSRLTDVPSSVEDVASVSFRLEGGLVGTLHCAYVMPDGLGDAYDSGFVVWGDQGDITWAPVHRPHPTVVVRTKHPGWPAERGQTVAYDEKLVPQAYGGTQFVVDYFRDMIRRLVAGEDHIVTGEDALRVVEICEAAYRAAATGWQVAL